MRWLFSYLVSGLRVSSDLALPGLIACEPQCTHDIDVVIRAGVLPKTLEGVREHGPNWQFAEGQFLLSVPGVISMLLIEGREIRYQPEGTTQAAEVAIFLCGTGFGILLHQRERVVLHASAVRVRDSAVLFCGPSGAGKSTLAAGLVDAGYDLVTDDFCSISIRTDGAPWAEPDGRQLKLWQHAIDRLSLSESRVAPVRPQLEKYYVEPRAATATALPLAAIYVLREARPPNTPGIVRQNIVDAGILVRGNSYRPTMVRRFAQSSLYFQASAAIAARAGVFTLTREINFDRFSQTIDWLEAHWRELGLLERAA